MKKYLIIVEKTDTGYSAFSPDVPGCGSVGDTKEEVERNIQEAIEFHLEGLREEGYSIPEPSSIPLTSTSLHRPRPTNRWTRAESGGFAFARLGCFSWLTAAASTQSLSRAAWGELNVDTGLALMIEWHVVRSRAAALAGF